MRKLHPFSPLIFLAVLMASPAWAEDPSMLPPEELQRLKELPFLPDDFVVDRIEMVSGSQRVVRYYGYSDGSTATGTMMFNSHRMHSADLNGDGIPDLVVVGGEGRFLFYAGCGNGLFYSLKSSLAVPGGTFSLERGTGLPGWKDIVIRGESVSPLSGSGSPRFTEEYRFVLTVDGYRWDKALFLESLPWVPAGFKKLLHMPEQPDTGNGKQALPIPATARATAVSRESIYGDSSVNLSKATYTVIDINGDTMPDLLVKSEYKASLYAGCGKGLFVKVFDDFQPGDSLGEAKFEEHGLRWKTIKREAVRGMPPLREGNRKEEDDWQEDREPLPDDELVFIDTEYRPVVPDDILALLALPVPAWAEGLPISVFYGDRLVTFDPAAIATYEYTALDGSGERRSVRYTSTSQLRTYAERVPFTLNSSPEQDYYVRQSSLPGSSGEWGYTFLAGMGHGRFYDAGTEYMEDHIWNPRRLWRTVKGIRWYSFHSTQRAGDYISPSVPVRFRLSPKTMRYEGAW